MINVLHLIKTLNLGGAERNLYNLCRAFDAKKVTTHIGYSFGGEFEIKFTACGVPLFKFAARPHKIKSPRSFVTVARLYSYIKKNNIDIIHTHTFNAHVWGLFAARFSRRKLVEHVHDFRYLAPGEYARRRGLSRQYRYIRWFKNAADRVIVLTEQNRRFIIEQSLYPQHKIRRIPNGIPHPEKYPVSEQRQSELRRALHLSPRARVVLTPCRLAPEKNIDLIMRIAERVVKKVPETVFIIAGDGPLLDEFKKKANDERMNYLRFIGFYSEITQLLSVSQLFLLPSFLELHSIALLEAMSMGVVPVVAGSVGCHDEFIVAGENGIVCDPFTDAGWAEALIALLNDSSRREAIAARAQQTVHENFGIGRAARRIEELYNELIG